MIAPDAVGAAAGQAVPCGGLPGHPGEHAAVRLGRVGGPGVHLLVAGQQIRVLAADPVQVPLLRARPQVQAGLAIGKFVKEPFDEESRKNMFGQRAKELVEKK